MTWLKSTNIQIAKYKILKKLGGLKTTGLSGFDTLQCRVLKQGTADSGPIG